MLGLAWQSSDHDLIGLPPPIRNYATSLPEDIEVRVLVRREHLSTVPGEFKSSLYLKSKAIFIWRPPITAMPRPSRNGAYVPGRCVIVAGVPDARQRTTPVHIRAECRVSFSGEASSNTAFSEVSRIDIAG